MSFRYSTRSMLILSAASFCLLVFHRHVAELIVQWYWLLLVVSFLASAWYARKRYRRSAVLPLLAFLPTCLVVLYSSYSMVWVMDRNKAENLFRLPAVKSIINCLKRFWYSLNAFWREASGDTTNFYYAQGLLETQFSLAIVGIIFSGMLGCLAGKLVAPIGHDDNGG